MANTINLNADMGESFGAYTMGNDAELMTIVGSANIACGFHAGDSDIMRKTVQLAKENGVSIGAHPSFPDLVGFGRRQMTLSLSEIENLMLYQIGALTGVASAESTHVTHVKPHGALNNMACEDDAIAGAIAGAVKAVSESLILLAPAGSCLYRAGVEAGLVTASEIFADRAYDSRGNLVPRSQPGAVIHEPDQCVEHVLRLVNEGIPGHTDNPDMPVHSICVHGDTDNAIHIARQVKISLAQADYELVGLPSLFHT